MRSNFTNSFIALGPGGSLGFGYVLQLYLVYNHKFATQQPLQEEKK